MDTRPAPNRVGTIGTFSADDTNVISAHGVQGKLCDSHRRRRSRPERDSIERDLDAARAFGQPYAVTAVTRKYAIEEGESGCGDHVVVSVDVTAPVDGQVTVHSATSVRADHSPAGISCRITTEAPGLEQDDLVQTWTPGVADAASTLAGVRIFDLSEGTTQGYHLNCNKPDREGPLTLIDSVLTATFTPAPAS